MKARFFAGLALALALVLLCAAALAEVRTNGNVWMRTGPGLDFDPVTSLAEGKSLSYLGESEVDERGVAWYKVSYGQYTGWVSSRYTELVGESAKPAPTVEPTAQPTAEPAEEPAPTEGLPVSLPALNAGLLFSDALSQDEPEAQESADGPEEAPDEAADRLPAQSVELSAYYGSDLVDAANAIGLISYRQVESEAPFQYYDDSAILAGNQSVENIVVYGGGYEVFGVSVGMSAAAARACLNAAGLDFYDDSQNILIYEHRADDSAPFKDENGHDSCINLWLDGDGIVIEIDWSTYTG